MQPGKYDSRFAAKPKGTTSKTFSSDELIQKRLGKYLTAEAQSAALCGPLLKPLPLSLSLLLLFSLHAELKGRTSL